MSKNNSKTVSGLIVNIHDEVVDIITFKKTCLIRLSQTYYFNSSGLIPG